MTIFVLLVLLLVCPGTVQAQDERTVCQEILNVLVGLEPQVKGLTTADASTGAKVLDKLRPVWAEQKKRLANRTSELDRLTRQTVDQQEQWATQLAVSARLQAHSGTELDTTNAQMRDGARSAQANYYKLKTRLAERLK